LQTCNYDLEQAYFLLPEFTMKVVFVFRFFVGRIWLSIYKKPWKEYYCFVWR